MKRAYATLLEKYNTLEIVHNWVRASYTTVNHTQFAGEMALRLKRFIEERFTFNFAVYYTAYHNHDMVLELYKKNPKWREHKAYIDYQTISPDQGKLMLQAIATCFEAWDEIRIILSSSYATREKAIVAALELIKHGLKFDNVPKRIPKKRYHIKRAPALRKKISFEIEQENLKVYEKSDEIIKHKLSVNEKKEEEKTKQSDKQEKDGMYIDMYFNIFK